MSFQKKSPVKNEKTNKDLKTEDQISNHSISTRNASQFSTHSANLPIDTFSVYSYATQNDSDIFKETYKKVAIVLESMILVVVLIIILKKVSLYQVFNVVTAVCYPTICLIIPSYFYTRAIKQDRQLTMSEHASAVGISIVGVCILVLSIYNLFF